MVQTQFCAKGDYIALSLLKPVFPHARSLIKSSFLSPSGVSKEPFLPTWLPSLVQDRALETLEITYTWLPLVLNALNSLTVKTGLPWPFLFSWSGDPRCVCSFAS